MKVQLDCLPCVLRQVLEAFRMATDNAELQKIIMAKAIRTLNDYQSYDHSPEMEGVIYKIVKDMTGAGDPYHNIKQGDINLALRVLPDRKFYDLFYSADVVLSKGQGNYESLSDCDRGIYFLLKAKCPVLSRALGVDLNDYVFKYYNPVVL
jgi:uncharacterized protein with ATP-grasp and redox domains